MKITNECRTCLNCNNKLGVGKIAHQVDIGLLEVTFIDHCASCRCLIRKRNEYRCKLREIENKLIQKRI
jgi:hypothetical protein